MKTISAVDAFTFAGRVFGDYCDCPVDAAYLFAETRDNEHAVLSMGAHLYRTKQVPRVALLGMGEESGYPGYYAWKTELMTRGVSSRDINPIHRTAQNLSNTFTEAQELVRCAKKALWKKVLCVAPAFHMPRAFLGVVTVVLKEYPELQVYAQPGFSLSWTEHVVHSQGIITGTRTALLTGEFERMEKYDNLVHPSEALRYLDERDRRAR